jgi:hypothetical protein
MLMPIICIRLPCSLPGGGSERAFHLRGPGWLIRYIADLMSGVRCRGCRTVPARSTTRKDPSPCMRRDIPATTVDSLGNRTTPCAAAGCGLPAGSGCKIDGVAFPRKPDPSAHEDPDLADLATRAAQDPSARAFVEEVKAAVADGSIQAQLANQTDLRRIIQEHSH